MRRRTRSRPWQPASEAVKVLAAAASGRATARESEEARGRNSGRPRPRPSSSERLLRGAALLVAATWIPGILGAAAQVTPLEYWSVTGGYIGASWAMPGAMIGLATQRWARRQAKAGPLVWGWAVGASTAGVLLIGAATCFGS